MTETEIVTEIIGLLLTFLCCNLEFLSSDFSIFTYDNNRDI
jgi:hypothetical protein